MEVQQLHLVLHQVRLLEQEEVDLEKLVDLPKVVQQIQEEVLLGDIVDHHNKMVELVVQE